VAARRFDAITDGLGTLNDNAYLQLSNGALAAYVLATNAASTASSVQVSAKAAADVDAGVAAGTYLRVAGCVRADTNEVTLLVAGRSNMLSCGNGLYLSTGTGTDIRSDCVFLHPQANFV
jgi:hypothetical protein